MIRPTDECPELLPGNGRKCLGLLLFLLAPDPVFNWPTVTVSALRVLPDTDLQSTVFAEKCPMTLSIGLILLTGIGGCRLTPRLNRLCRATRCRSRLLMALAHRWKMLQ